VYSLIREHRYVLEMAVDSTILRIEEFISGPVIWPQKYRLRLHATHGRPAKSFYGDSPQSVAEQAAEFILDAASS
jgi:hypothetical protein